MLSQGIGKTEQKRESVWARSAIRRLAEERPGFALFLASLAIAVFSSAWLILQTPDFFSGYDFVRMHLFYKSFFRNALLHGRLPLWNPYVSLGRPFLADIETESLYPPNLLVLPFGVTGGIALSLVLHQTAAIYCGLRLARFLGAAAGASFLFAIGIALANPFTGRLASGMVPVYFLLCWWPGILWLGGRLQDRWDRAAAAGLALAVALAILAGNPPILYVEFLGLSVFLAFRSLGRLGPGGWRAAVVRHAGIAFAGLLGIGLAAIQILPFAELVGQGNRPLASAQFASANAMTPWSWLTLLLPTSSSLRINWEYDLYCGLVPLFAAGAGILLVRDRNARALLGLGLVGALLACGDRTPVLGWAIRWLPGAAALRFPSRYAILSATAILGLAALGLTGRPRHSPWTVLALLGGAIASLLAAGHRSPGGPPYFLPAHIGLTVIAAGFVLFWCSEKHKPPAQAIGGVLIGAFCCLDWGWAIHVGSPVHSWPGQTLDEGSIHRSLEDAHLLAPGGPPPRLSFDPRYVRENSGMTGGFSTYNGYANPALNRVWTFLHYAAGVPVSDLDFIQLPQSFDQARARLESVGLDAEVDPTKGGLVASDRPHPRAYLAFDSEISADWRTAERKMAAGWPICDRVLLEEGSAPSFLGRKGETGARADIKRFEPERIIVRVNAPSPAILVLAEAWYPGWSAVIGDQPAAVFPVNGWMRGVVVPAGQSTVSFIFRSRLLSLGAWLSLICAIITAAMAYWPPRFLSDKGAAAAP